jgi:hypothetical protein
VARWSVGTTVKLSIAGMLGGSFGVGPYAEPNRAPAIRLVVSQNSELPRGTMLEIFASANACQLLSAARP